MHTDIVIEPMAQEHISAVAVIEKICFAHPWSVADLEKQLTLDTSRFVVAKSGEKVVGYMGLQIFSAEGYVTNVAVLPEYRRQGIGRLLLSEEMKNDMAFISLEVRESNLPAIRLYESVGFVSQGVRPKFYTSPTENALIMTKYFEDEI